MKKFVSILLALLMCVSVIPIYASASVNTEYPIIYIPGDATGIYDKNGRFVSDIINRATSDDGDGNTKESVMNVLKPLFSEGVLLNKWDNYYAAFEKEVDELVGDFKLDTNGDAPEGSGISQEDKDNNTLSSQTDYKLINGSYSLYDYCFWFDWRLDPYEIADEIHDYVQSVKTTTGAEEVCIYARCLGGIFALAYLDKYGETDGIHGVAINGTVGFGDPIITEGFCGEIVINDKAIERNLIDGEYFEGNDLSDFIYASLDLAVRNHIIDAFDKTVYQALYKKLYVKLTYILSTATFGTLPSHWAIVEPERYEEAKKMVFGDENGEKYKEYSGLIEKIDYIQEHLSSRTQEIVNKVAENSNMCILAQYGHQVDRFYTSSADEISDSEIVLRNASGFATVAEDVYSTLDEDYIKSQTEKGLGKYISPDKQIDASTCYFPEFTWFEKGVEHASTADSDNEFVIEVMTNERQLTCDDHPNGYSRFMIKLSDGTFTEMTEENCRNSYYPTGNITGKETFAEKNVNYFKAVISWLKSILTSIKNKFKSLFDFDKA